MIKFKSLEWVVSGTNKKVQYSAELFLFNVKIEYRIEEINGEFNIYSLVHLTGLVNEEYSMLLYCLSDKPFFDLEICKLLCQRHLESELKSLVYEYERR